MRGSMEQGLLALSGGAQPDASASERVGADGGAAQPLAGNVLAGGLGNLLASFGVVPTDERDVVEDVVERELAARGHAARVLRLHYSTLYLEASAQAARFLRYDTAALLEALEQAAPGQVEHIRVRVAR